MSLSRQRQLLRLTDDEITEILENLDRTTQGAQSSSRRRHTRSCYRAGTSPMLLGWDQDAEATVCIPRNLSVGGMAALYRGFLHQESQVQVILRQCSGELIAIRGLVRTCRHVCGMLHEIGIEFEKLVDLSHFCDNDAILKSQPSFRQSNPLPRLSGVAIYISNNEHRREGLCRALRSTGLVIEEAPFLGRAIDLIRVSQYDIILADTDLDEVEAEGLITSIRAAGHSRPIICLAPALSESHIARVQPDQSTEVVPRPVDSHDLCTTISTCLGRVANRRAS